jgi:HNH endonuclease
MRVTAPEIRFFRHVLETPSGCHEWQASLGGGGYGKFSLTHSKTIGAHRFAYVLAKGEIPRSLVIDHLCLNKKCVRPDHLEAITQKENTRRHYMRMTHCKNGHLREGNNILERDGQIKCRACMRDNARKSRGLEPLGTVPVTKPPRAETTHCPHGHEYTDENTAVYNGSRYCRECSHIRLSTTRNCPRGHVYAEVGTRIDKLGRRWCIGCYPNEPWRDLSAAGLCPKGHPYDGPLAGVNKAGQRYCGVCPKGRPKKS